jgi:tetratricopeptide (TPR) repeat protein
VSGDGLDRVGAEIAGHRLVREIDRGGRSAVFEAVSSEGGEPVAVKVLAAGTDVPPAALDRARRQARLVRELADPGLCAVFEVGEEQDTVYAVERLVEGESLDQTIAEARRTHPIAVDEALHFVERACGALHGAHSAGLVHGDLRPSKVLVDADGLPVVLDLGLGPLLESGEDLHEAPFYRAPEVLCDGATPDARGDVYSLGAVLFELLTLRRPFEAPTREALQAAVIAGPVPDLHEEDRALPADLAVVVATALAPDPVRRYQSAADFAADLRAVRERRPITARSRRKPLGAAAVLLFLLVAAGAAGLAGFLVGRAPVWTEQRAEERRQEHRRALVADPAGQDERERTALMALLAVEPENDLARVTLVMGLLLAGRTDEALAAIEAAPAGADSAALARLSGPLLAAAGRGAEAAAAGEELGQPGSVADAYAAGLLALSGPGEPRPAEAVTHLFRAALLSPAPELPVLAGLGRAAQAAGDAEHALAAADALAEHFPGAAAAWGVVSVLREGAGDLAGAIAACDEVLTRDAANAEAHARLVRLHLARSDHDAAAAAMSLALAALDEPGEFRVRAARGLALVARGANADGLAELERALALDGDGLERLLRDVRIGAAHALVELGRGGEAIALLRAVLEAEPQDEAASELLARALEAPVD